MTKGYIYSAISNACAITVATLVDCFTLVSDSILLSLEIGSVWFEPIPRISARLRRIVAIFPWFNVSPLFFVCARFILLQLVEVLIIASTLGLWSFCFDSCVFLRFAGFRLSVSVTWLFSFCLAERSEDFSISFGATLAVA